MGITKTILALLFCLIVINISNSQDMPLHESNKMSPLSLSASLENGLKDYAFDHRGDIAYTPSDVINLNTKRDKIKWGKIPAEDLAMTKYVEDTSAHAVILNDEGDIRVILIEGTPVVKYRRHIRIKFLSEEGFDWANVKLPCYTYKREQEVVRFDAQVILRSGEKIKVEDIVKEKRNNYYTDHKFSAPKIEVGAILEYRYKIESSDWVDYNDWYFQQSIPLRNGHLAVTAFDGVEFSYLMHNDKYIDADNLNFSVKNLPAMEQEAYVTNINDYRCKIKLQLRAYLNSSGRIPVYSTWDKIISELLKSERFGFQFRKKRYYKSIYEDALHIIESTELDNKSKALALGQFIKNKVKWDHTYGLFPDDKLNDLYAKGEANAAGLNLMLLALLKEAKIPTVPVLVSTRYHGKLYPFKPFIDQFNHTLLFIRFDQKEYFIDLTDKNKSILLPDTESLNYRGMLIDKQVGRLIAILPKQGADIFYGEFELNDLGEMTGPVQGKYTNYNAVPERDQHEKDSTGVHWQSRLSDKFPEVTIEDVSCQHLTNLEIPFKDQFTCTLPGAVEDVGDFLYINPNIYTNYDENPFTLKNRQYPIDYPYPLKEQFIFKFKIPEGYIVESIPQSAVYRLEDKSLSFTLKASADSGVITIMRNFKVKNQQYPSELYPFIKEIYDRMIEKMNELIVLKKAE